MYPISPQYGNASPSPMPIDTINNHQPVGANAAMDENTAHATMFNPNPYDLQNGAPPQIFTFPAQPFAIPSPHGPLSSMSSMSTMSPQYLYTQPAMPTAHFGADNHNYDSSLIIQENEKLKQEVQFWKEVAEQQSVFAVEKDKELLTLSEQFETLKVSHFLLKKLHDAQSESQQRSRMIQQDVIQRLFHEKFEACPKLMTAAGKPD